MARIARTDEKLLHPVEHGTEDMRLDLLQIKLRLTFILTVGDPTRVRRRRAVAAYFGLVPKRDPSGDTDKQLRNSKAGNQLK